MANQDQQLDETKRKRLTEETSTERGQGPEKRRDRVAGWLGNSSGVQIVTVLGELAAVLSIIVAAVTYYTEREQRDKEKHYQAWQAINTAQGQGGSGGRIEALEDLNRDEQSLVGVSAPEAYLQGIDLAGGELDNAQLQGATLSGADLQEASLKNADLQGANLGDSASDGTRKASLRGAHLEGADARGADLSGIDLRGAWFNNADLNDAILDDAQLQGAHLKGAVLENANLIDAKLHGADFSGADLYYADFSGADLRGAKHLTQDEIDDAFGNRQTQLPQGPDSHLHMPDDWKHTNAGPLSKEGPLPPGDYTTDLFDAPMSFTLGEGWAHDGYETDTFLGLDRQNGLGIYFVAPDRVYDPHHLSSAKISPAPNDMVAWLREHPYLHAVDEPIDVTVGGVPAQRFDVQIPTMPQNYPGELCEEPCLPMFVNDPVGTSLRLFEGGYQVTVLRVDDQTVVIFVDLEEGTPAKAKEVLKTIKW